MANIKDLRPSLDKFIRSIVTDAMKLDWAQNAADTIYKRTKSGRGLSSYKVTWGGVGLKKLDDVSPGYAVYRKGRVSGAFAKNSGRASNLTFSGELLESIAARISSGGRAVVELQDGQHSNSDLSIRELADKVSKEGRPFFGLADSELKILDNYIRRKIRDRIRSLK